MSDKCDDWDFNHKGTIVPYGQQLAAKDAEIAQLRDEIATLSIRINDLHVGNHHVINNLRRLVNDQNARITARLARARLRRCRVELAEWRETWTDERGTVWRRPTAWAYAQTCRVRDGAAEAMRAKCEAIARENKYEHPTDGLEIGWNAACDSLADTIKCIGE